MEHTLAPTNVSQLAERWTIPSNGSDFSAPIVVGDTLYFGSWNGTESAVNASTGAIEWSRFLGTDPCGYNPMGISSTPTYANGTLYLGGGDGYWYALNAKTGAVDWRYFLGAPPSLNNYNWASALVYRNSLYIGVASCFDNPLIPGELLQLNITPPYTVNHTFDVVPPGQTGGSIWTTPALDPANNTLWISTGNEGNDTPPYPPYVNAIVALNASTLTVLGSWQIGSSYVGDDEDFGSTPTLCYTVSGVPMVVATNKNGIAYALDRSNVSSSGSWNPVWTLNTGGGFSSGAFDGHTLYLAGSALYAVNPANGSVYWTNSNVSGVYSALTAANGVVYVGSGSSIYAIDAANGSTLWNVTVPGGGSIVAESVVFNGQLYVPSGNYGAEGNLTAYGIPLTGAATVHPLNGTAPLYTEFRAQAHGGLVPYSYRWEFGDGTAGFGASAGHVYAAGNWTATVWINDSAGRSLEESFRVSVKPHPTDPGLSVSIAATPEQGVAPLEVLLNASEHGGILPPYRYDWSFGDGSNGSGVSVYHRYASAGVFAVNLTVLDSANNSAVATTTLDAVSPLVGTIVSSFRNATCPGSSPLGAIQLVLNATATGGKSPDSYQWTLNNETHLTGAEVVVNYSGPVHVSLTVTDSLGDTSTSAMEITHVVYNFPSCPPSSSSASAATAYVEVGLGAAALLAAGLVVVVIRRRRLRP